MKNVGMVSRNIVLNWNGKLYYIHKRGNRCNWVSWLIVHILRRIRTSTDKLHRKSKASKLRKLVRGNRSKRMEFCTRICRYWRKTWHMGRQSVHHSKATSTHKVRRRLRTNMEIQLQRIHNLRMLERRNYTLSKVLLRCNQPRQQLPAMIKLPV